MREGNRHSFRENMPMGDAKLDLLVYGASGHAKVIIDAVIKEGKHRIVAIIDDDRKLWKGEFCGYPVVGGEDVLKDETYRDRRLILAISDNAAPRNLWETIKKSIRS